MEATLVIAGGYTAGHLTPGLAIAAELRERYPHLQVLFAGRSSPEEEEFVRHAGFSFLALPASPWASQGLSARTRTLAGMLPAVWMARRRLRDAHAVSLISLGSFVVYAPALAARSLGLPVTIFEPNARFGLANQLLRPFATEVLASRLFEASTRPLPRRCTIVGVPLRSSLQELASRRPAPPHPATRLLVLGGSLGSPFLNERVPGLTRQLQANGVALRVTHQCGRGVDAAGVRAAYGRAGVSAVVEPFFDPIAPVVAEADFVVTAAGAITLHEVAAAGVPLLTVPLRAGAAAHQYFNAEAFGQATGCLVRTEETWDEITTAAAIAAVLRDPNCWLARSRELQAFVAGNARGAVVDRIVASLPTRVLRP